MAGPDKGEGVGSRDEKEQTEPSLLRSNIGGVEDLPRRADVAALVAGELAQHPELVLVLTGDLGVGRKTVALAAAVDGLADNTYDVVWHLGASSTSVLDISLRALVGSRRLPCSALASAAVRTAVSDALAHRGDTSYLLVISDVEDWALVEGILPPSLAPIPADSASASSASGLLHVLVTMTDDADVPVSPTRRSLCVPPLPPAAAGATLARTAPATAKALKGFAQDNQIDAGLTTHLLYALWAHRPTATPAEMQQELQQIRRGLRKSTGVGASSLAAVVALSVLQMGQESMLAVELINLASYCAPGCAVPLSLLVEKDTPAEAVDEAKQAIVGFQLGVLQHEGGGITVHAGVARYLRSRHSPEHTTRMLTFIMRGLRRLMQACDLSASQSWSSLLLLLPHAEVLLRCVADQPDGEAMPSDTIDVAVKAADTQHGLNDDDEAAEETLLLALSLARKLLGDQHATTSMVRIRLARILMADARRRGEAKQLVSEANGDWLDERPLLAAQAHHVLGLCLLDEEDAEAAITEMRRAIQHALLAFKTTPERNKVDQHLLASIWCDLGMTSAAVDDAAAAIKAYQQGVKLLEGCVRPVDGELVKSMTYLATLLIHQGKVDEAVALLQRCGDGIAKVLGPKHYGHITSRLGHADLLVACGASDQGIELYRSVLKLCRPGSDLYGIANASLATALLRDKQTDEGLDKVTAAADTLRTALGPDPRTAEVLLVKGQAHAAKDDWPAASAAIEEALDLLEKCRGDNEKLVNRARAMRAMIRNKTAKAFPPGLVILSVAIIAAIFAGFVYAQMHQPRP